MKRLLSAFNTQRCLNPAICLGLAEGALEEAVRYMRSRSAFGRKIGEFQGLRWKAADRYIEIEAARATAVSVAARPRRCAISSARSSSSRWTLQPASPAWRPSRSRSFSKWAWAAGTARGRPT
ncbi:MAG: acyl-CoA dehydrogenase family protein [Burkholderiales bacterium]